MWSDDSDALHGPDEVRRPWEGAFASAAACPHCGSARVAQRHLARRLLGLVGTLAGATGSAARAWSGAELGSAVGMTAGPPGIALGAVIGALAGAVLGALVGGSTGCAVGVRLGDAIDTRLLNDLRCLDCDHAFNSAAPTDD